MYDVNDSIVFAVSIKDANDTLVDPTQIDLTITAPDGSTSTPTPDNPGVGLYEATVLASLAGQYVAVWRSQTPNAAYTEVALVRQDPGSERMLVSLEDTRRHLNLISTDSDEELRETILVSSKVIEDLIGPVLPEPRVERHRGLNTAIALNHRIYDVTSVVEHPGGAVPAATGTNRGYLVSDNDYSLELVSGETPVPWSSRVVVTYDAGIDLVVPSNIRQATRELVRHLWNTQRGPLAPRTMESENYYPGLSFTLPRRVIELLGPLVTPAVV